MTPDYSKCSLTELRESLSVIDGRTYPENKAALDAEIQARKDSGAYAEEEQKLAEESAAVLKGKIQFARKAESVIAWYLIATGSFALVSQVFWPPSTSGFWQTIFLGIGLVYMLATVIGGVAIIKGRSWGSSLVIGLLCVQLVQITSSAFSLKALSALAFYVTIGAEWTIGFSADFGPGFWLEVGTYQPFLLGVNIFVAWLMYLLVTANNEIEPDSEAN